MRPLLFQPEASDAIKCGVDAVTRAIKPTLGPVGGTIAIDDATRKGAPELLDEGGTIARRILQLPDRGVDVGAMLLREVLWRQHETFGDGAATAAVLYQTVFAEGHRFIRAGGNAMLLRRALENGLTLLLEELRAQVQSINSLDEIRGLARSISGDAAIADAFADIFDVLGPHHPIETRDGGRDLTHEFFLGSFWQSETPSNALFECSGGGRVELSKPTWLLSDFEVDDLDALVRLVTDCVRAGRDSLVIVAKSFSQQMLAAQAANQQMQDFTLVYLQLTGLLDDQEAALEDLALLTGGLVARTSAGHRFERIKGAMLGKSDLAWVDRDRFGIIVPGGESTQVEAEIARLEQRYDELDDERRKAITRARIGRLRGGSAVVYCGGSSESEMRYQKSRVARTIAGLRQALLSGTLPGGGLALLRCVNRLLQMRDDSDDLHEQVAWRILIQAAEAPCRQLLLNSGHEAPGIVIDAIQGASNGAGYDLSAGEMTDMRSRGIVDSAAALMSALRQGIGGAALALTIDTIVQRTNPPLAIEPGGLPASADLGNIELK